MRDRLVKLGSSPGLSFFITGQRHRNDEQGKPIGEPAEVFYSAAHRQNGANPGVMAEQVYLWRDQNAKDIEHNGYHIPARPFVIEGWQGYEIPHRLGLTRQQARWLVEALTSALLDEEAKVG